MIKLPAHPMLLLRKPAATGWRHSQSGPSPLREGGEGGNGKATEQLATALAAESSSGVAITIRSGSMMMSGWFWAP
jgi:hypothetical protein